jgi:membrane peptidoglycan carboxypeptidase
MGDVNSDGQSGHPDVPWWRFAGDARPDAVSSYSGSHSGIAVGKFAVADEGRNLSTPSDPGMPSDEPTPRPTPEFDTPRPTPEFEREPVPDFGQEPASQFGRRTWRRFFSLKRILLVLLGLFLTGAALVGVAFATTSVPQPNDLALAQASIIYYADGKTEMYRISTINREVVPYSKIPLHVQHALLAAEDRSFYQEHGVSPTGIGRALLVALKGGPTQGGSTITQQYVKNYFLTQDRTISRKAKEFIISIKIDQSQTKNEILTNYLNTIYYGRGAYGIQTASKAYFGHDASRLTVAEGALLASVIRGPSYYDPALGKSQKANAVARMKYVLDGMVAEGWLTPSARAKVTFPKTIPKVKTVTSGTIGYIVNDVKLELTNKYGYSKDAIDSGGLRIVTTIDKKAEDSAIRAVNQKMPPQYFDKVNLKDPNGKTYTTLPNSVARALKDPNSAARALHVGLTAIRPNDGAVVAMYGGKDFLNDPYNSSTQATMQGGSTFKVFGLLAALQKGISTKTVYDGYSPRYMPEFNSPGMPKGEVKNFGNEQVGRVDLRTALGESVNTIFAQLNLAVAAPGTHGTGLRSAAIAAGLPAGTRGLGTNINNVFGTASPHVIDMANAYATIAAQGQKATPYLITSVKSAAGVSMYKVSKNLKTAFTKPVTADVTEAMTHVVTDPGATGQTAQQLGRPAAGKTGTTTDNLAAWFDGFTPQLSTAVGMYMGDGTNSIEVNNFDQVTGGTFPLDIWTAFMEGALQGQPVQNFPARVGVGDNTLPPPPAPPTHKPTPTPSTTSTPVPTTSTPPPTRTRPPRPTKSHPTGPPVVTPPPTITITTAPVP